MAVKLESFLNDLGVDVTTPSWHQNKALLDSVEKKFEVVQMELKERFVLNSCIDEWRQLKPKKDSRKKQKAETVVDLFQASIAQLTIPVKEKKICSVKVGGHTQEKVFHICFEYFC